MQRIIFGISGASGIPLAISLLQALNAVQEPEKIELHLIISKNSQKVIWEESKLDIAKIAAMAQVVHEADDFAAHPSSGSWRHSGMIICPCSMSSLGAIANGAGSNLIHRAADVAMKERHPLIIVPRETPFSAIHLENMLKLNRAGAVIMPPCPAFYTGSQNLQELIDNFSGRVLDQLGLNGQKISRWKNS